MHLPWSQLDPVPVIVPNSYAGFPIMAEDGRLTRTVIVRINGVVEDPLAGYGWKSNYVITEDHYIDYMGGRIAEEVVPGQILAKLREASCLFLGYQMADWRLRVFLHWIWGVTNSAGPRTGPSSATPTCSSNGSGIASASPCTEAAWSIT